MGQDEQAKIEWLKVLGVNFFPEDARRQANGESAVDAGSPTTGAAAAMAAAKSAYPAPPAPKRHSVTAQENAELAEMDGDALRKQDLTQRDPKDLFTEDYMDDLVGLKVQGANDAKLKEIMRKLAKGVTPGERKGLIAELARIRGVDPAKLDAEYDRFMILRAQQDAVRKEKNEEVVPDLAEDIHGEFMGSNPQLVFGKVIGDAFGVDPVFGALLSPTGGMVGPGNQALQMDDDDPTGYHGIVHDAAGYLHNYHDQGPGYDYLGKEAAKGHSTDDPLTGQQSGMRYWHEKLDPGAGTTVLSGVIDTVYTMKDAPQNARKAAAAIREGTAEAIEEFKIETERALDTARKTVNQALDRAMQTAADKAKQAGTALEQAANEAADAARAAKARVEKTATTALNEARQAVGSVRELAAAKLDAAWEFVWS